MCSQHTLYVCHGESQGTSLMPPFRNVGLHRQRSVARATWCCSTRNVVLLASQRGVAFFDLVIDCAAAWCCQHRSVVLRLLSSRRLALQRGVAGAAAWCCHFLRCSSCLLQRGVASFPNCHRTVSDRFCSAPVLSVFLVRSLLHLLSNFIHLFRIYMFSALGRIAARLTAFQRYLIYCEVAFSRSLPCWA